MKTKTKEAPIKSGQKRNWALPDQEVPYDEFLNAIKKAEQDSFLSEDEFKKKFYQWRKEKYGL